MLERLPHLPPGVAALLEQTLGNDASLLASDTSLHAVIDSAEDPPFARRFPEAIERGLQVVSPLTARLLWGLGVPSGMIRFNSECSIIDNSGNLAGSKPV